VAVGVGAAGRQGVGRRTTSRPVARRRRHAHRRKSLTRRRIGGPASQSSTWAWVQSSRLTPWSRSQARNATAARRRRRTCSGDEAPARWIRRRVAREQPPAGEGLDHPTVVGARHPIERRLHPRLEADGRLDALVKHAGGDEDLAQVLAPRPRAARRSPGARPPSPPEPWRPGPGENWASPAIAAPARGRSDPARASSSGSRTAEPSTSSRSRSTSVQAMQRPEA
jgi:hypothetical protein